LTDTDRVIQQAREILTTAPTPETIVRFRAFLDSRIKQKGNHMEMADICEEVGLFDLGFREVNLALRDTPDEPGVIRRVAEYCMERGETQMAVKLFERLLHFQASAIQALETLVDIYSSAGDTDAVDGDIQTAVLAGMERARADRIAARFQNSG